ncbi:MAG: TrbC family F-type conjugative pilus assembly protein [Puia sp.]|nr:TrbC family F-type conjugative pilus assembly protein [Puia sp.]
MLRLMVVFLVVFLVFSISRAQDNPSSPILPEIGKDVPGVDPEKLQQDVDKVLQDTQKKVALTPPVLPVQEMKDEGNNDAQKAVAGFNSPENQKKLEDEKARVQQAIAPQNGFPLPSPQVQQGQQLQPGAAGSTKETVYIFLSSSVPDKAVHAYLTQASQYGDGRIFPVFYGLTSGIADKQAANRYFGHVLQEDLTCTDLPDQRCSRMKVPIKVNPGLFTQYSITQVPAVVYTNGEDSWVVNGDSTLVFMLERINGEARSPFLTELIKREKGTH